MKFTRREAVGALAVACGFSNLPGTGLSAQGAQRLPEAVAGVPIPETALARAALAELSAAAPAFLVNHSLRVFVFGSLVGRHDRIDFDSELLLVASCFHDIGLLPSHSTPARIFEIDGADAGRAFMRRRGESAERAQIVWNMCALHTSALASHYHPAIALVSAGASVDFYGAFARKVPPPLRDAVVAALPRLNFRHEMQALLRAYCRRNGAAQAGSWTDVFCQTEVPGHSYPSIANGMGRSPYTE